MNADNPSNQIIHMYTCTSIRVVPLRHTHASSLTHAKYFGHVVRTHNLLISTALDFGSTQAQLLCSRSSTYFLALIRNPIPVDDPVGCYMGVECCSCSGRIEGHALGTRYTDDQVDHHIHYHKAHLHAGSLNPLVHAKHVTDAFNSSLPHKARCSQTPRAGHTPRLSEQTQSPAEPSSKLRPSLWPGPRFASARGPRKKPVAVITTSSPPCTVLNSLLVLAPASPALAPTTPPIRR